MIVYGNWFKYSYCMEENVKLYIVSLQYVLMQLYKTILKGIITENTVCMYVHTHFYWIFTPQ